MPRRRREHHDPLRRMRARGFAERFDFGGTERVVDQNGVPGALGQQRLRHLDIRNHAGLAAPALQPPRHQRGLDALRRHQHDRLAGQIRRDERLRLPSLSAAGKRNRHFEGRAHAGLAFQRDAAAHSLDDALARCSGRGRCRHSSGAMRSSACSNSRKMRSLRLGRDADAGVAHQEADFVRPDAGLDDQRHAAGRGELDRVAGEVEQHLPQPRGVADHLRRQPLVDIGGDLELARLRPRRQQFGDVLDQGGSANGRCSRSILPASILE